MSILPAYTTPDKLAAHLGASPRRIRRIVKEHGLYALAGGRTILLDHHITELLKVLDQCPSEYSSAAKTGGSAAPSPEGNYTLLAELRTKPARKGSPQKPKPQRGSVISMDRGRA